MLQHLTGFICGDKCTDNGKCRCGNDKEFQYGDGYYCCTNVTCSQEGYDVKCPEGKSLLWNTFCQHQGQCPISLYSSTAVSSNCGFMKSKYCPNSEYKSSIICSTSKSSMKIEEYCSNGKACNEAIGGLTYEQCYDA